MSDDVIVIPEHEFFGLYSTLSDATDAAASGDTNTCASKAADAREMVLELSEDHRHKSDAVEIAGGESDA